MLKIGIEVSYINLYFDPRLKKLSEKVDVYYARMNSKFNGVSLLQRYIHNILNKCKLFIVLLKCYKECDAQNADILHFLCIDFMISPLYFSLLLKPPKKSKIFGNIVGGHFTNARGLIQSYAFNQLLSKGYLEKVFVFSESEKNTLQKHYKLKKKRISVIPPPLKIIHDDNSSKITSRHVLNLPEKDIIILFFGTLRKNKGPDILLKSLVKVNHKCTLVFAGKEDFINKSEINEYKKQIKEVNIVNRVGWVPTEYVKDYFLASDVVIIPYRRSFGAMRTSGVFRQACGAHRPLIVPNFGEMGKIVQEKKLGLLFESEDPTSISNAINEFVMNKEEIIKSSENGLRQFAKEHQWDITLKKVYDAYKEQ
jgi:glycosyltransferase involved in cell wall biosynthesis